MPTNDPTGNPFPPPPTSEPCEKPVEPVPDENDEDEE